MLDTLFRPNCGSPSTTNAERIGVCRGTPLSGLNLLLLPLCVWPPTLQSLGVLCQRCVDENFEVQQPEDTLWMKSDDAWATIHSDWGLIPPSYPQVNEYAKEPWFKRECQELCKWGFGEQKPYINPPPKKTRFGFGLKKICLATPIVTSSADTPSVCSLVLPVHPRIYHTPKAKLTE